MGILRLLRRTQHPVLRQVHRGLRKRLGQIDRAIDKRTLARAEFESLLTSLGFTPGAVVFVHSSLDELARRLPGITPMEVIDTLQRLVGPDGTLLMPTFPFQGLQVRYAEQNRRFDVRRTPSQVGLMTEVFRRLPEVTRSLHPTHPVAAWGRHARVLTGSHHLGGTFAATSPICNLREYGGLTVGLGIRLEKFTIAHVPEELHPEACARFFEPATRTMTIADGDRVLSYELRCLRAGIDRDYGPVEATLLKEGVLRYVSAGGLRCAVTPAGPFIQRSLELLDRGRYLA